MKKVVLLAISGPSSSGKSTLARRAAEAFTDITVVKLDNFYRDTAEFRLACGWPNWELPENFAWQELRHCLEELRIGRPTSSPIFSKRLGKRVGHARVAPGRLVIVEGFHILSRMTIRKLFDYTVYLDVSRNEQWARRKGRDHLITEQYFEHTVRGSYRRYGRIARAHADVVLGADAEPDSVWEQFRPILRRYL